MAFSRHYLVLLTTAHDLIIVNFANPDMVGHTGDLAAAIKAVEIADHAVGQAVEAIWQMAS